jgi:regulator of protease activity HflC (stomatin/prohibitin superfamily)
LAQAVCEREAAIMLVGEPDPESDEESRHSYRSSDGPMSNPVARYCGIGCCGLLTLVLVAFPLASIRTVEPGHIGLTTTFGFVEEQPLQAGTYIVNPFAQVTPFSTRTTLLEFKQNVPTKEGLSLSLEVAMLYHLNSSLVRKLFLDRGVNFKNTLIRENLNSAVRGVTAWAGYEALYNSTRDVLQLKLKNDMQELLGPSGIVVENILLNDVVLPQTVVHSINEKANAQQQAIRMKYVLQKATKESKRKAIEAEGIQQFQQIVSDGISPELLQWKGIEATEKFSASSNPKIVVMGNSGSSLPVLMNSDTQAFPQR